MSDFWYAGKEVVKMATELLGQHHPEVATANFGYVFKDKASNTEAEAGIVATAKKVSPLYKMISRDDLDFIVVISADIWSELSLEEQVAHLDSALCSCSVKLNDEGDFKLDDQGNPIFCLRPFDLQGHSEIIARHGIDVFSEVGERLKYAVSKSEHDKKEPAQEEDVA